MTISEDNEFLFVTDWKNEYIWRVSEDVSKVYGTVKRGMLFKRLWFTPDSHVIALQDNYPPWLNNYDDEYNLIRSVTLCADMRGLVHAVATKSGGYIISHGTSYTKNRVCEVTSTGETLRCHGEEKGGGSGLLDSPRDVAVDVEGYVYIADNNITAS